MNTKVILILFILLLNVAMIILINKKGTKDPLDGFFNESSCNIDCSGIEVGNTAFCNAITSCRKKPTSDTRSACENRCLFNPLNRRDPHQTNLENNNYSYNKNNSNGNGPNDDGNADCSQHNNSENQCNNDPNCYKVMNGSGFAKKCVSKSGREADGKFPSEEETGAYTACNEYCNSNWDSDKKHVSSDVSFYTDCKSSDCVERCTDYLLNKSNTDLTSYGPYPTNRIGDDDYDKLKSEFIHQLATDPALKERIKDNLYQNDIIDVSDDMDDIETKNQKLGEIMSTLKRLNGTGNNFLQQVDQLGEFQNKYSSRIDEILDSRKSDTNNKFETKIQNLSLKISKLKGIYDGFDENYNIPNLDQAVLEPYKQISTTTGSGEVILNLTPVRYKVGEDQFYLKRKGAYLINGMNENDYLHYSNLEGTGFQLNHTRKYDPQPQPLTGGYTLPSVFSDYFSDQVTANNILDLLTDDNRTYWAVKI